MKNSTRKDFPLPRKNAEIENSRAKTLPIRHRKCFGRVSAPLQEEMNALFDEIFSDTDAQEENGNVSVPAIKISENETSYNIEVGSPGIKPEDVDICTTYNFITISGETKNKKSEHPCPSFHRTFSLPETADTAKAKATLVNGILKITMPKKAHKKANRARK